VYFALRYANTWFGLVLGTLGGVLQILCYMLVVVIKLYSTSDAGLLSVALSMASNVLSSLLIFRSLLFLFLSINAIFIPIGSESRLLLIQGIMVSPV